MVAGVFVCPNIDEFCPKMLDPLGAVDGNDKFCEKIDPLAVVVVGAEEA